MVVHYASNLTKYPLVVNRYLQIIVEYLLLEREVAFEPFLWLERL